MREMVSAGLEPVISLPAMEFESQTVTKHKAALKKTDWRNDILSAFTESVEPPEANAVQTNWLTTRFHSMFKNEFTGSRLDGTAPLAISAFHLCTLKDVRAFGEQFGQPDIRVLFCRKSILRRDGARLAVNNAAWRSIWRHPISC